MTRFVTIQYVSVCSIPLKTPNYRTKLPKCSPFYSPLPRVFFSRAFFVFGPRDTYHQEFHTTNLRSLFSSKGLVDCVELKVFRSEVAARPSQQPGLARVRSHNAAANVRRCARSRAGRRSVYRRRAQARRIARKVRPAQHLAVKHRSCDRSGKKWHFGRKWIVERF
jgi:hypothetical protein